MQHRVQAYFGIPFIYLFIKKSGEERALRIPTWCAAYAETLS